MYHLGKDLGWDWIWASYLIKYAHNGWSCDLCIFGHSWSQFSSLQTWHLKRPCGDTWHKSRALLNLNICIFPEFFTLFLRNLGAPSWMLGGRTITWNGFIGFHYFGHKYHLGQDWRWASYLIKHPHNGWSCDLGIFGIPEVNFPARAFKLHIW